MQLPLFPLHTVLFPGRPLPLHLFEPRYREMLADCLAADQRFGVVAIRRGREVGPADLFHVGTVAGIEFVDELSDGRYDIVARGVERFRVGELRQDRSYLSAEVEPIADPPCAELELQLAAHLRRLLVPYLACLGAPEELLDRLPKDPCELGYLAAAVVQVEVPEQQRLLELASCGERLLATARMVKREVGLIRHLGTVGALKPPSPGGAELN